MDLTLSLTASECFDLLTHSSGSPLSFQVEPVLAALVKTQDCSPWSLQHLNAFPTWLILPLIEDA